MSAAHAGGVQCPAMTTTEGSDAARRWAEDLGVWAVPQAILDAAPAAPHAFDVGMFARIADEAQQRKTPS